MPVYLEQFIFIVCPLLVGAMVIASIRLIVVSGEKARFSHSLLVILAIAFMIQLWNRYVKISDIDHGFLLASIPLTFSFWLIGPLIYLAIKKRIHWSPLSLRDGAHVIPYIICCLAVYSKIIQGEEAIVISILLWSAITMAYLALSAVQIFHLKIQRDGHSAQPYAPIYLWGAFLLLGLFMFVISDIVIAMFMLNGSKVPDIFLLVFELSRSFVALTLIALFQFSRLITADIPGSSAEINYRPYEKSSRLNASTASEIQKLLEKSMSREKIFRQTDISLRRLSEHLSVGTHELSEVLNKHMNTNFYAYINYQRIRYAAALLTASPNMSIIDIATNSGYTNKTTFYSSFKKILGTTPSVYRATHTMERGPDNLILP